MTDIILGKSKEVTIDFNTSTSIAGYMSEARDRSLHEELALAGQLQEWQQRQPERFSKISPEVLAHVLHTLG